MVVKLSSPPSGEWASDPNLAIPVITAALLNNPDTKVVGYPGGQMLGNVPTYMQAAGKKAGDIFNFGFDTSPQIVEGFKGGWVQLTADQQPFLQGYLPILSLCQQVVLGLAPMNVDTGAGFVTPQNYEIVAELAEAGAALIACHGRPGRSRPAIQSRIAMAERLIELRDITKSYGRVYALGGVNLTVDRGEVVGLIGDNGAGKSTLIKILAGVVKPTSGEILIRGTAGHRAGARPARARPASRRSSRTGRLPSSRRSFATSSWAVSSAASSAG